MLKRDKREKDFHKGKYNGVGGKFEQGETPEECLIREVFEETGLTIEGFKYEGVITFPLFDGDNDWYTFVYTVDRFSGELTDSDEGTLHWINDDQLTALNLWEGDPYFLEWIYSEKYQDQLFSSKFVYRNKEYISHEVRFYKGGKIMNPIVTITMVSGQEIKAELYPEIAPNTVKNFIHLINQKFYDGLIFHRVISGFMIQGGCPQGKGTGGPGYGIKGEFLINGVNNSLKHERGVLSMARSGQPDSAGSQFFIMHKDSPHLDTQYAGFGKVIEGIEIVDEIASSPTGYGDKPVIDQQMVTVTVDTQGVEYEAPETN
jgi:peptidyl-prolyl cis-trans isomerase B (cyclophilin B)